jgi:alkanesulfonate monooxygenase SsuD/methylene tetrahydromethanopterin reductase-like flavin-dependent oxidoreductase (luciferase family)
VARTIAYYVGGMGTYYRRLIRESGFALEASMIRDAWQRGDRISATKAVSEQLIDSVALTGSPDDCRRGLEEFREAGITLPIISLYIQDHDGPSRFCESIKALTAE